MKRAIGIVRVSATKGREGESFHSPETQLQRIKTECERQGLRLVQHFEELDISGTRPLERRPGLKQAVDAVEAKRADVIVVAYFDRLVRSMKVQAEIVERVERAGGNILALDAGQITNGKAATKLQANMLGAIAQYVSDNTRDKVMEAQERAVALGIPPWPTVPPGYLRGPDKRFVPDPKLAPVVADAFEARARGASINAIRRLLLEHGVKRTYGGVAQMLGRRTYLGEIHFGKLVNLAAHPPIVDRDTFRRVQEVSPPRDHPPSPSDRLLARLGILRCASCGSRLVVKPGGDRIRASGERVNYKFYWCRNPDCDQRVSISATLIEGLVIARTKELAAELVGNGSRWSRAVELCQRLHDADGHLERVTRRMAAAGVADELVAVEMVKTAREARDALRGAYNDALDADVAARLAITAEDVFGEHGSPEGQRELIRAVIERVEVARGKGPDRVKIRERVQ